MVEHVLQWGRCYSVGHVDPIGLGTAIQQIELQGGGKVFTMSPLLTREQFEFLSVLPKDVPIVTKSTMYSSHGLLRHNNGLAHRFFDLMAHCDANQLPEELALVHPCRKAILLLVRHGGEVKAVNRLVSQLGDIFVAYANWVATSSSPIVNWRNSVDCLPCLRRNSDWHHLSMYDEVESFLRGDVTGLTMLPAIFGPMRKGKSSINPSIWKTYVESFSKLGNGLLSAIRIAVGLLFVAAMRQHYPYQACDQTAFKNIGGCDLSRQLEEIR